MVGSGGLLLLLALDGTIGRLDGVVLMAVFAVYMYATFRTARTAPEDAAARDATPAEAGREDEGVSMGRGRAVPALVTLGGLLAVLLSSSVLVTTAIFISVRMGVPSELLGLTIVAVGTSLPELATSVVAARKGESDISVGNVVGSNIFNVLLIVGTATVMRPLVVARPLLLDMVLMVAVSLLVIPLFRSGYRLDRREGVAMLAGYVAYMVYLATMGHAG